MGLKVSQGAHEHMVDIKRSGYDVRVRVLFPG